VKKRQASVVVLLPESPFPARSGNALRDAFEIDLLQRLGVRVTVAAVAHRRDLSTAEETAAIGSIRLICAGAPHATPEAHLQKVVRKTWYVIGDSRNAFAWWVSASDVAMILTEAVAAARPSLILMRSLFVDLLPAVRAITDAPVIVDCHDADVQLASEMLAGARGVRRLGPWANLRAVRRAMRQYLHLADEVWAVSDEDAEHIRRTSPLARLLIVPSGLAAVDGVEADGGSDPMVAMVANFEYGPNTEGALWLLSDVWPRVVEQFPEARLALIGRGLDTTSTSHAAHLHVEVPGPVAHLDQWYRRAAVVAAPVLRGSGTRLKIVDAWRHGKAVVATRKAIEGLPDGERGCVTVETADGFANAIIDLLMNRARRVEVATRGLTIFRSQLSADCVVDRVANSPVVRRCLAAATPLDPIEGIPPVVRTVPSASLRA
jgi:glycosyltransferase involved in cell wall biosynthesis